MALSNYLEDALLGHVFLGEVFTPPTLYVALFTAAPDDAGSGTEVAGGGYTRQAAAFVRSPGTGKVQTSGAITFTGLPACTVVAAGLYDAAAGGNLLAYGDVPAPVTYVEGDNATAAAGAFTFTLD